MDGVDYVYAINSENKVYKKQVVRGSIDGDKVEVKLMTQLPLLLLTA